MVVKQIKDKNLRRDFLEHKVAVHCATFEEATALVDFLNKNVRDDRGINSGEYRSYGEETTIVFSTQHGWGYENVEYSEVNEKMHIVNFNDFVVIDTSYDEDIEIRLVPRTNERLIKPVMLTVFPR